jgi:hypothetical protein
MDSGTLCLVTTVREPGASFESFLRYHLAIGIAHIVAFFDDPQDPAIAIARQFGPAVTVIPADDALRRRYPTLQTYATCRAQVDAAPHVRQALNAEIAIGIALEQGHRWLLHLDGDELLFSPTGSVKAHLDHLEQQGLDMATYVNFEAVPTTYEVQDPFREVRYFKINPGLLPPWQMRAVVERWLPTHLFYFTAYSNGRTMVRLRPGILPNGRLRFHLLPEHRCCETFIQPLVLHYPHCGLAAYTAKFARLAATPEADTLALAFYQKSLSAYRQGGPEALRPLYEQSIMVPPGELLMQHLGDQTLGRFNGPAEILAQCEATVAVT